MSTIPTIEFRQRGFGLLEVMIAVAVLSIALLSLGGLHTIIIKSSSAAKVRGVATSLASEKLDDLRSFGTLDASGNPTGSGFSFDSISTGAGGNAGTTLPPAENVTFTRTWHVYPLYVCGVNAAPSLTNSCAKTTPDMKLVNVAVYWDDQDGVRQSVALQSTISWVPAAKPEDGSIPSASGGPEKILDPNYNAADQDIMHNLGDVLKRVSQPVPDTNRGNNDTTFNTVTSFHEEFFDTNKYLLGENEFVTVNCYCNQLGAPANSTDVPFGLEPTTLVNNKYVAGDVNTTKRRGAMTTGGQFNDQPKICNVCCRDHHDDTTQASKYDPFRPSGDFFSPSVDHNHYAPGTNATDVNNANNDPYAEACRMAWVDGRLRVLQDWRLESLVILPPNFFNTQSNITLYTDYVTAFVTEFVKAIDSGYPGTMPRRSTILAQSSVAAAKSQLPSARTMSTSPEQLSVRGIYIDFMDIDLINTLKCKINLSSTLLAGGAKGGASPTCAIYGVTATGSYLQLLPFHDVNLTKLAQWSSSNGANISVTSDSLLDQNEATFSRGKITGVTNNTRACISARINTSNTGLTVSESIDPEDLSSSLSTPTEQVNPIVDKIPVTFGSSAAADPCTTPPSTRIKGTVITTNTTTGLNPNDVYIRVTDSGGTQLCTFAVNADGSYDTDTSCSTQLAGATGLRLYIWHYTHGSGSNYHNNCVLNNTTPPPYSTLSILANGQKYTGNPTISGFNALWEHSIVSFSGLTAGSTTTFNFTINNESTGPCTPGN